VSIKFLDILSLPADKAEEDIPCLPEEQVLDAVYR
jgi:hypothetical protein